jgi:hypothetical protein
MSVLFEREERGEKEVRTREKIRLRDEDNGVRDEDC